LAGGCLAGDDRNEVVIRDRIFVLLTQKMLFDKHIEIRRTRVRELALEQPDRVNILLPTEDQLRLFLALRHLLPHWHGDCQRDCHHAHGDQQNRHGVALFGRPVAWLGVLAAWYSGVGRFVQSTEVVSSAKLFLTT
jgi:hypothetical protein